MGATCLGVTTLGLFFGGSREVSFLVFNIDAARADEKTLLDTFEGSNICVEHGSNIVLNISGASSVTPASSNLFKDVFSIEDFGKSEEYVIPLGDEFRSGWDILFESKVSINIYEYISDPNISSKGFGWNYLAEAEVVRLQFVAGGHPNASVTRSDSGARTWFVTGLESYNFAPRNFPNYPINVLVSIDQQSLAVSAFRNDVNARVFSVSENLESDQFMNFSFSLKAYPKPITVSEYQRQRSRLFPDPIAYL